MNQRSALRNARDDALAASAAGVPTAIGGQIGNENVVAHIRANLANGERLIATLLGVGEKTSIGALFGEKAGAAFGGQYLIVTDRQAVAIKSGIGAVATGSLGGLKTKAYVYDSVTSVDVNRGLLFGEIEILVAGMTEKSSGGCFSGAVRDSVIQFEKKYFDEVVELARTIRTFAAQARHQTAAVGNQAVDIPDQIRKVAELREAGTLTEEEFQSKKRSLLERL